jgi:serine/threonine-protein kinase
MDLRTRVWGAGKLLLLIGALAATYFISAAAGMRIALKAREVQVPDLTNRTANEATAIAGDLGLSVRLDDVRRSDPKIPAGRVIAQDPAAGTTSRQQRVVRVWLSTGPRSATAPALTGESERTAQLRLREDGLEAALAEVRSAAFASDVVIAQDPPPNTPGSKVTLLVNRGEQADNYVMPDLIGVNGDRAAAFLRNQGFRVAVVASTPYPGVAAGIVLRQSPQAGFQIAPGEPISIEVSR